MDDSSIKDEARKRRKLLKFRRRPVKRQWGRPKGGKKRQERDANIRRLKKLGVDIKGNEKFEKEPNNSCEQNTMETKQVLRLRPLTELEEPIISKSKSLLPNPHVQPELIRILKSSTTGNVDKNLVATLRPTGVKFIGSGFKLSDGQSKRVFLIKNSNSTNPQITTKPQLFTIQTNSNLPKFLIKERVPASGKPVKLQALTAFPMQSTSGETPLLVTNPISRREAVPVGNPFRSQVLNTTEGKVVQIISRPTSETKKMAVLKKEIVLVQDSLSGLVEHPMAEDPINASNSILPTLPDCESSRRSGRLQTTQLKTTSRKQATTKILTTPVLQKINSKQTFIKKRSTSVPIIDKNKQPEVEDSQFPSTSTHDPISSTEPKPTSTSQKLSESRRSSTDTDDSSDPDYVIEPLNFVDMSNIKPEIIEGSENYVIPDEEKVEEIMEFIEIEESSSRQGGLYPCKHCQKDFPTFVELVKHWMTLNHSCDTCGQVFASTSTLQLHLKEAHNIKGYKCTGCNLFESNFWNLKIHQMRGHCQEYKNLCEDCDRTFKSPEDLQLHVKQVHEVCSSATFLCDICGKACKNDYTLQCHIQMVHRSKKYPCPQCSKVLHTRPAYARHLRWHKMKKIVCEQCGKRFEINSELKIHMRQHTGERPHICSICSKAFAKRTTLRQHLLIHSGKRPYVCDICGKAFTQKPGLTAHRKSHPGDLPPMPSLFIDEILKELPDGAFQNLGPKSVPRSEEVEEKQDDPKEGDGNEANVVGKGRVEADAVEDDKEAGKGKSVADAMGEDDIEANATRKGNNEANSLEDDNNKIADVGEVNNEAVVTGDNISEDFDVEKAMDDELKIMIQEEIDDHVNNKKNQDVINEEEEDEEEEEEEDLTYIASDDEEWTIEKEIKKNRNWEDKVELNAAEQFSTIKIEEIMEDRNEKFESSGEKSCEFCGEKFHFVTRLVAHLRISHGILRPFKCDSCGKTYPQQFMLNAHIKKSHTPKIVPCSRCDFMGVSKADVERHSKRLHKEVKFICEICSEVFTTQEDLMTHTAMHEFMQFHQCNACGSTFDDLYSLREHNQLYHYNASLEMQKEENPREHKCDICGKTYKYRSMLKQHKIKGHSDPVAAERRRYLCALCGKELKTAKGLEIHTRSHTGEKPYTCEVCGKCFACETLLRTHSVTHTGERKYSCDECGKAFTQRSTLVVHKRYHSGERPYLCPRCSKGFVTRTVLNTHLKSCR